MKNITLITKTNIINKIFTLVCKNLEINLNILNNDNNIKNTDLLIIDDDLFDTNNIIRYKSICSNIAILTKEMLYEYESLIIIKKPFLPSSLNDQLENIIINLNTKDENNIEINEDIRNNDDEVNDLVDFIDSIEDDKLNYNEHIDEIYVSKDDLGHGGVLDKEELDILHDMISDSNDEIQEIEQIQINENNNNWLELSEIIDKAIDDVQAFDLNDELVLILNQYTMDELSPLLNKLDQKSIDKLSCGEELILKIKLENNNA